MHLGRRCNWELGGVRQTGRGEETVTGPGLDLGGELGEQEEEGKLGEQTALMRRRERYRCADRHLRFSTSLLRFAGPSVHSIIPYHRLAAGIFKFQQVDIWPAHEHAPHRRASSPHRLDEGAYHIVTRWPRSPISHIPHGWPSRRQPNQTMFDRESGARQPCLFQVFVRGPVEGGHGRAGEAHCLVPGPRKHWRTAPSRILDGEVPLARC